MIICQLLERHDSVDIHHDAMENRRRQGRLRTPGRLCKPTGPVRIGRSLGVLLLVSAWASLPACSVSRPVSVVTLDSLEAAPSAVISGADRHIVSDSATLRALCTPIGPRLGLVQIRTPEQWQLLVKTTPDIGPCPDLRKGTLVGVACWAGTPVDGHWPIELEAIQVSGGGGLLKARFHGGSFLPDGTTRLETDYVLGLQAVLVVDVNGTSFYPEQLQ